MSEPVSPSPIECRALTRFYGDVRGIEDLDLTVGAGQVVGFLGPNGAGKTTVLRMLAGLLRPTAGEALLFGESAEQPEARARTGFMPADPAFYRVLSGTANLDLLAELQNHDTSPDRAWAVELVGLAADELARPVGEYSSGMVQKLGLVQAVQHRPDVVVLDEPANRLDPIAHNRFEQMVLAIADQGRTVLLSSHTLSEVESVCDSVAMVRDGRMLLTERVAELMSGDLRRITVRYSDPPAELPEGLIEPELIDRRLRATLESSRLDVVRSLLDDATVEDLLIEPVGLEESFLHLYQSDER